MPVYPDRNLDVREAQPVLAQKVEAAHKAFIAALNEAAKNDLKVEFTIDDATMARLGDRHKVTAYTGTIDVYARVNK